MQNLRFGEYGVNWASPQAQGLVGWWPECRFDLVGDKQGVPVNGIQWTPLSYGASKADFTRASSHYVNLGNVLDQDSTKPFSFFCWMLSKVSGTDQKFLSKIAGSPFDGYQFRFDSTDATKLYVQFRGAGGALSDVVGTTVLSAFRVYHTGFTYDGLKTSTSIKIYLDGKQESTTGGSSWSASTTCTDPLFLGARSAGADSGYLDGHMWDARFYQSLVSPLVVAAMYAPQTRHDLYLPHRTLAGVIAAAAVPGMPAQILAGN